MDFKIKAFAKNEFKTVITSHKNAHKGGNGKVLVIADSDLFHAPGLWASELLAHFVDMVYYFTPEDIDGKRARRAYRRFHNGIIISQKELSFYINEADVIVMGPGIRRDQPSLKKFMNELVNKYPQKIWVLDAGALQVVDPELFSPSMILTPHKFELARFVSTDVNDIATTATALNATYSGTWLVKAGNGVDWVYDKNAPFIWKVEGGNRGLTKGGSGDLLAALTAFFRVFNDAPTACAAASFILKYAADTLYETVGPYYTITELISVIPKAVWELQAK